MEKDEKIERMILGMLAEKSQDIEYQKFKLKGFEKFYLYTNEYLNILLKRLKIKEKKVLTVGSSGDQILYSLLNGAKEVVCFDICPFSEYYYALKTACIKNLTYEEFDEYISQSPAILSPKVYRKVSHGLNLDAKEFWDHLYLDGFNNYEFHTYRENIRLFGKSVYINNKELYGKLQEILRAGSAKVSFIESDLREITCKLEESDKFDVILLSNIIKYTKNWNEEHSQENGEAEFMKIVKGLASHLNKNGCIQIDYAYHKRLDKYLKYAKLLGKDSISSSVISFDAAPILYRPKDAIEEENE